MPLVGSAKLAYMRKRYSESRRLMACPLCGKSRFVSTLQPNVEQSLCLECSIHQSRGGRRLTDAAFIDFFWSLVDCARPSDCWLWKGDTRGKKLKYGRIFVVGNSYSAHRVAWLLAFGSIPDNLCVLHHCDNPLCVNPSHLFLGTTADNNRDRCAKGRSNHVVVTGEQNGKHKLDGEQVSQIKVDLRNGAGTSEIGRRYGVSHATIYAIKRGLTWVSVE